MSKSKKTSESFKGRMHILSIVAVLSAIEIVLAVTPLGYIPLGVTRATTIHIPVIVGAILLGPKAGAFLGGIFGLTSFISNTINPTIASFVFTPFYPMPGETNGSLWSILICFLPRILIGVFSAYFFRLVSRVSGRFQKTDGAGNTSIVSLSLTGIFGSLTNTVLVMTGIYVFFGSSYSSVKGIDPAKLLSYILGTVIGVNGVLEAVIAGVLVSALTRPLLKIITK